MSPWKWPVLLSAAMILLAWPLSAAERIAIDRVRVVVDNLVLTDRDLNSTLQLQSENLRRQYEGEELERRLKELKAMLTDRMVEDLLLENHARKIGIEIDEKEINQRVDSIIARQPDAATTYTDEELKNFILKDLLKRRVMQREINAHLYADDAMIDEACQAEERDDRELHVAHILVRGENGEALERIRAIRQELQEGASFEEIALADSDDPSAAKNKGDLGFISRGQFVKPFEDEAFSMDVGEISAPVKSKFGYHIIKLIEVRSKEGIDCDDLDDVNRARITDKVYQRLRTERMQEFLARLRDQAEIKVFDRP